MPEHAGTIAVKAPVISVVIPTWRDWSQLERCLDALARQTLPRSEMEIVVANNDPASPCPFALAGNVRVIDVARPGSYAARNAAVRETRGRYLAFTDSDCVPAPGWAENAVRALDQAPEARITGPITLFRTDRGGYYAWLYESQTAFRQEENVALGECVTANLVVPRTVFDRVGPFDTDLLSGGDVVWNRRATAMGVPMIYGEGVSVAHPARTSIKAILRKRRRTAGSLYWAQHLSSPALALRMARPPVDGMRKFGGASLSLRDRAAMFAILWLLRIAETTETLLVRWKFKRPLRS